MKRIVIVSAKRTPFGRFRGALAEFSPVDLAVFAGDAALIGLDRTLIDQVILGNVLSAGQGMNIARQVAVRLRLPIETSATTINMMCGSGMQSALMAVTAIRAGEANAVLAGGTESMSQSPLLIARPAKGQEPDFEAHIDSIQRDGLVDSFDNRHMGEQAEKLATAFGISRNTQDAFAERSQHLYGAAHARGDFADEIVAVGKLTADQHPRPLVTQAELAQLQPAFQPSEESSTVTAGNASGINDGAAILLLADLEFAKANGWSILAEWIDGVVVGCDPARMGLGPVNAIRSLLHRTQRSINSIDTLEINEAFAAQTLACLLEMNLWLDGTQVKTTDGHAMNFNSEGGAIAIGHPLAASGARLLTHLAWKAARGHSTSALGSLCIGGGMGIAALLSASKLKCQVANRDDDRPLDRIRI
jgi:acetyl-CoA C-acetyltransferase